MKREKTKAKKLEEFLKFLDECKIEYDLAAEAVGKEDTALQDMLHEMEFAPDKQTRNKIATKLHYSRVRRRENKDNMLLNEEIVTFFFTENKAALNKMRELGRQRKKESYLNSERYYRPRSDEALTIKLGDCEVSGKK
ncbi:MAG: hypothetical protein NC337_05535 [Roseburia sp.]|nr:hypothetical protein [Roseburia sp.]